MSRPQPITPLDIASHIILREASISPDGSSVVFTRRGASRSETPELPGEVWLARSGQPAWRLTFGPGTDQGPRWSPDSQQIAFISDRAAPGQRQLYQIGIGGGEARRLSDLCGSLDMPQWSPDGSAISFLHTPEAPAPMDGNDADVEDEARRSARVWALDAETQALKPLTPDGLHVYEYAWSPDSRRLALVANPNDATPSGWYTAQLYVVEVASGEAKLIYSVGARRQLCALTWSPDSRQIAYMVSAISDQPLWSGDVCIIDADGGQPRQLTPREMPMSITHLDWLWPDQMIYSARQLDGTSFGRLDIASGATQMLWSDYATIADWTAPRISVSADGRRFAAILERPDTPPQVWAGSLDGDTPSWEQISQFEYPALALGKTEPIRWTARDGLEIVGHVVYPTDYEPGRRYPTLCQIHGGPTWSWLPHYQVWWEWWSQFLAGRGYVVFMPNIRGSAGRGTAYAEANVGDMGGEDFQDAMSGLDRLIELGIADPDRLAIGGWSYGGFMTAWAVTQTRRFKAAIMGAGIANWESYYAQTGIRAWQTTFFGSTPYEAPELHRQWSPLTHIHNAVTPTLILHGQEDHDVSLPQAYEMYEALKAVGVDTQLVTYPREHHPILERAHQLDLLSRIEMWLNRYLQG